MPSALLRFTTRPWSCTRAAHAGMKDVSPASPRHQHDISHQKPLPQSPSIDEEPSVSPLGDKVAYPRPLTKPPFPSLGIKPPFLTLSPVHVNSKLNGGDSLAPSHPRNRDRPVYRSVYMNGLPESVTLTDITQAIAAIGPFGMITNIRLIRKYHLSPSSRVEFGRSSAADSLVRVARSGAFYVNGMKPYVTKNKSFSLTEPRDMHASRVLRAVGPPDVEGFSELGMREVLRQSDEVAAQFRSAGRDNYWGFDSEPVSESMTEDGRKVIVWPFFSIEYQATPFLLALRKHFGQKLSIDYGIDPCGCDASEAESSEKDIPDPLLAILDKKTPEDFPWRK